MKASKESKIHNKRFEDLLQCHSSGNGIGENREKGSHKEICTILEELSEFKAKLVNTHFEILHENILCLVEDYTETGVNRQMTINSKFMDWATTVSWVLRTFVKNNNGSYCTSIKAPKYYPGILPDVTGTELYNILDKKHAPPPYTKKENS
ncbi:hypothetical protein PSN45_002123 [Yamadazyma tenuis]|uniref:Uncharacterized protein n=1 Tax=Candida tenuis (strain ATCC 10573 / BCRC 21748 / CBS 615 / JCM 9827 / NBRC 10315 / NRRL Y-1498 / VKM Y-70) TaxID=590646 RepID=G3BC73_CANTC|nr:uncharacterized protein CANTEDRAFT_116158 [Yamadazyma tenuis ATCC 10573]XP_006690236.1 uncharacterized protein CANTEDRAFT_116158 [Yamadazyma tenuis ATCC 10573]EGV61021.1 hypothetical protein CANTEDRAFT_116158 [Yamadazyma tenuis ATCC 10573]EGV61022.1 hypothetical protein CANTEDRAFT_116158 [Yamadazyma tenuis ATCC 10573]WEJ94632.1 hypothetical protein PSN45_002123 [Yamadazyma tenuis]